MAIEIPGSGWIFLCIWFYVIGCVCVDEKNKRIKFDKVHFVFCKAESNSVWTWARSFNHATESQMGQHWQRKLFLYFSHLAKFRRKRDRRTPAGKDEDNPGWEKAGHQERETEAHQERGRGERREGAFWMWPWAHRCMLKTEILNFTNVPRYASVTQTNERRCTCGEGFIFPASSWNFNY